MLSQYLLQTTQLLQNPDATNQLYRTADLTAYINTARGQIAGEAQCIRVMGSIPTVVGQNSYAFIDIDVSGLAGTAGVLSVQNMWFVAGSGQTWFHQRSFPWFSLYELNNANPDSGPPNVWAEYMQGATGSFYVSPLPDDVYTIKVDSICYPVPLVSDSTPEALPYLWTDAVPFWAAYQAYMSGQQVEQADMMYKRYQVYMQRARAAATPEVLAGVYAQGPDPVSANRLGQAARQQGGGQG